MIRHILITITENVLFLKEKYIFLCAKRKANRKHYLTGKRYWVLKLQGKYRVFNAIEIKDLKRRKIFAKNLNILTLNEVAAYSTNEIKIR